jgi:SAM-dependent methyltransferase
VTERPPRTATPESEDFFGKYEASGRVGRLLVDGYFAAVNDLVQRATSEADVQRALEIGCGPGYSTQRIRRMLSAEIRLEASEYVAALVPVARANNPTVPVEQEDAYELKREDAAYDLVFLLEVLEHLDYPDMALDEITRVLRPGGLLLLGVPREPIWRLMNMARGSYWRRLGNTPGHLNHWSARSIRKYVGERFGELIDTRAPLPWTLVLSRRRNRGSDPDSKGQTLRV